MTSCGLNNGPLEGKGKYEARIACVLMSFNGAKRYEFGDIIEDYHPYLTQEGEDREENPNQYIANMTDGSVAGFKYFDIHDSNTISIEVRGTGIGNMKITNSLDGEEVVEIPIKAERTWENFKIPVKFKEGIQGLFFTYEGSGAIDFNSFEIN